MPSPIWKRKSLLTRKAIDGRAEKQTLQSENQRIGKYQKKLTAELKVTENRITTASLSIEELGLAIAQKKPIFCPAGGNRRAIRQINQLKLNTFVNGA